jgi:hypothetical protein
VCSKASHVHVAAPLAAVPAPAFVAAQSSQVIARNYNGIVAPPVVFAAPAPVHVPAKVVAPVPVLPSFGAYAHHYSPYYPYYPRPFYY